MAKTTTITARITKREKEEIRRRAKILDQSMSEYLLQSALFRGGLPDMAGKGGK